MDSTTLNSRILRFKDPWIQRLVDSTILDLQPWIQRPWIKIIKFKKVLITGSYQDETVKGWVGQEEKEECKLKLK